MKNMFLSFIAATLVAIELLMSGCSYKSSDVLNDGQNSNVSPSEYSDISSNVTSNSDDFSKKLIDPFEGLEVQFDGIAPYCTVSFNNSSNTVEKLGFSTYSTIGSPAATFRFSSLRKGSSPASFSSSNP